MYGKVPYPTFNGVAWACGVGLFARVVGPCGVSGKTEPHVPFPYGVTHDRTTGWTAGSKHKVGYAGSFSILRMKRYIEDAFASLARVEGPRQEGRSKQA